ncbi:MAG: N-acyl homoserine lactonase family protein [Polyangiales bacterium]
MNKKAPWLAALSVLAGLSTTHALDAPASVQLYALDGGTIEMADLGMFSDTGEYDGKAGKLPAPSFLIRHPKGDLVWDAGLGDTLASRGTVKTPIPGISFSVTKTVVSQLAELGLAPKDVEYVAFSPLHGDHTGNAGLLTNAIWLVGARELSWARGKPTPAGVDAKNLQALKPGKLQASDYDVDVFGDGSVRILRTPGHTPDHRVLMLKLAHAGTVLLSGDLYHIKESVAARRVPAVNQSRADTLASFERVSKLLERSKGRLVVQHSQEDFNALPKFPSFLD